MSAHDEVLAEERAARGQVRHVEKMHRARGRSVDRERRRRLADAIQQTRKRYPACRCELHSYLSRDELRDLGSGCCDYYVCPRLDAVRRVLGQ